MPGAGDEFPIEDPVVERLLSGANLARLAYVGLDRRPDGRACATYPLDLRPLRATLCEA